MESQQAFLMTDDGLLCVSPKPLSLDRSMKHLQALDHIFSGVVGSKMGLLLVAAGLVTGTAR